MQNSTTITTAAELNKFYAFLGSSKAYKMTIVDGFEDTFIDGWSTYQVYEHVNNQHLQNVAEYLSVCKNASILTVDAAGSPRTFEFKCF